MTSHPNVALILPAPHDVAGAGQDRDWVKVKLDEMIALAGDFFMDGKLRRPLLTDRADALLQCLTRRTRLAMLGWRISADHPDQVRAQVTMLFPCTVAMLSIQPDLPYNAYTLAMNTDVDLLCKTLGLALSLDRGQRGDLVQRLVRGFAKETDIGWWVTWLGIKVRPGLPSTPFDPVLSDLGEAAWHAAYVPAVSSPTAVAYYAATGFDLMIPVMFYLDRLLIAVAKMAPPVASKRSLVQQAYLEQLAGAVGILYAQSYSVDVLSAAVFQLTALAAMAAAVVHHRFSPDACLQPGDVHASPMLVGTTGHAHSVLDCFLVVMPGALAPGDYGTQGGIVRRDEVLRQAYYRNTMPPSDAVPAILDDPLAARYKVLFGQGVPVDRYLNILAQLLGLNSRAGRV